MYGSLHHNPCCCWTHGCTHSSAPGCMVGPCSLSLSLPLHARPVLLTYSHRAPKRNADVHSRCPQQVPAAHRGAAPFSAHQLPALAPPAPAACPRSSPPQTAGGRCGRGPSSWRRRPAGDRGGGSAERRQRRGAASGGGSTGSAQRVAELSSACDRLPDLDDRPAHLYIEALRLLRQGRRLLAVHLHREGPHTIVIGLMQLLPGLLAPQRCWPGLSSRQRSP